jgi:S-formylglutathione hydrolase FrmB
VVGLVDRTFPVRAERAGRAIGGLSMGGYGAVKLGLKHHEMFASVNSHSGAVGFLRGDLKKHKDLSPEFARIFGEEPAGGPEDPFAIVERIDHGRIPAMRIDCGVDDFLIEQNRDFHKFLDERRIAHEYQEFPGSHNWAYWDEHVRQALDFHVRNLGLKPKS